MEQIQQHEWVYKPFYMSIQNCKHCHVERFVEDNMKAEYLYREKPFQWQEEEPVCTTRYPEKNIKEDETDNADSSR